jgi:sugar phosphate isomerase/epimerase
MNQSPTNQPGSLSRRAFCRSAAVAVALPWTTLSARSAESRPVKFFKNLAPGHIGVRANQRQLLDHAVQHGFAGISPSEGEFAGRSSGEIRDWVATMKAKGIRYGTGGLPVEFRRDEERFRTDLAELPRRAALLQQLGVTRVATWILPGHAELTYLENFKQHERRFREVAGVLRDHDIRLGLEFVGPRTSRSRFRFPFLCAQRDMLELVDAIGVDSVGLLLDSWHWYTSHGTVAELGQLTNRQIVHVHVNDAPADLPVDQQVDSRRRLPVTTGVIDMKGFINALARFDYDGPVECEPFDQELRSLPAEDAIRATAAALNRVWELLEA